MDPVGHGWLSLWIFPVIREKLKKIQKIFLKKKDRQMTLSGGYRISEYYIGNPTSMKGYWIHPNMHRLDDAINIRYLPG